MCPYFNNTALVDLLVSEILNLVLVDLNLDLNLYLNLDLKRYLLSRIAIRLLKIIEPYLVGQERTANAQLLRYGSKHLGQNFFFYCVCLDRFFPEGPSLTRTGYFKTVATIQLVWCVLISAVSISDG